MNRGKTLVIKSKGRFIVFMAVLIILAAAAVNFAFNSIDVRAENHPSYVTVQVSDGDTLWSIAEQYMSDTNDTREAVYDIQKANNMSGNDNLTVGSTIKVPVCE
jgi:LysM domain.